MSKGEHFTWLRGIAEAIQDKPEHIADTEKFLAAILLGIIIILMARKATAPLREKDGIRKRLIPGGGGYIVEFFDVAVEKWLYFQDSILGKQGRKYLSLTGSVFFFILFANLVGLIPGVPAITTTVWVNVAIALVVFVMFNWYGIQEHGVIGYLKHFCGPIVWLAPLVFCLEVISTLARILTLNLRLYWNISADHMVLEAFTDITKLVVPVAFYGLGTFVSFMQAFVFATLTIVYILLATQHEESH